MKSTDYQVPCLLKRNIHHDTVSVTVPGSKSITNRALLFAMLADGECELSGAQFSDDSRHFLACLDALGFTTTVNEENHTVTVQGLSGNLPTKEASLYVGSAGTAARFLTACLGVSNGTFHMNASEQMKRRPMAPLLSSLLSLGCEVFYEQKDGFFPFTIVSHGFQTESITIDIDVSSQFLSALLIASVLSSKDFHIQVNGSHGMAYVNMTLKMMKQFGVYAVNTDMTTKMNANSTSNTEPDSVSSTSFFISGGQHYSHREYSIEPDVSAACYFYALAAITGTSIIVKGVFPDSLQGDIRFLSFLEKMGCIVQSKEDGLQVTGPAIGCLKGITVDMAACSDQAITMAAIAPYANSPVTINGIGHIRFQESDRLQAIIENLTAMDIECHNTEDSISILPGKPKPAVIKTYDDHRLAMGFSLTGLLADGIVIENPTCCKKTFENYFTVLENTISQLVK